MPYRTRNSSFLFQLNFQLSKKGKKDGPIPNIICSVFRFQRGDVTAEGSRTLCSVVWGRAVVGCVGCGVQQSVHDHHNPLRSMWEYSHDLLLCNMTTHKPAAIPSTRSELQPSASTSTLYCTVRSTTYSCLMGTNAAQTHTRVENRQNY